MAAVWKSNDHGSLKLKRGGIEESRPDIPTVMEKPLIMLSTGDVDGVVIAVMAVRGGIEESSPDIRIVMEELSGSLR